MLKKMPVIELTAHFAAEATQVFQIFKDPDRWPENSILRLLVVRDPGFVQVSMVDRSRVSITITSLGLGRCELALRHELITSSQAEEGHKRFWSVYLKQVREVVEL